MFDLSANQKTQPFVYTKITIVNVLIQKIYKKGYFFFHIYGNYHILGTKIVLYKDIHSTAFTSVREFSDLSSLKINKCSNFTSFFFLKFITYQIWQKQIIIVFLHKCLKKTVTLKYFSKQKLGKTTNMHIALFQYTMIRPRRAENTARIHVRN